MRRRNRKEENLSTAILLKPDGARTLVNAEDMALRHRENPNLHVTDIFLCPGKNKAGSVCTCRLELCSWNDYNVIPPYFAHRDSDKTIHIEGCDQESGIRNIKYVDKIDQNLNNLDLNEMLKKMTAGEPLEPKKKEPDNDEGDSNDDIEAKDPNPKRLVDTEEKIVPVKGPTDLYELCVAANNDARLLTTARGWSPKGILINCESVDLYRSGEFPFRGPKLIVASTGAMNPEVAKQISDGIEGNVYVLADPYTTEEPNQLPIYYVLEFIGSDKLYEKYLKRIYKARENGNMVLVFGRASRVENEGGRNICKISIRDGRCRQIVELRKSYEDESCLK